MTRKKHEYYKKWKCKYFYVIWAGDFTIVHARVYKFKYRLLFIVKWFVNLNIVLKTQIVYLCFCRTSFRNRWNTWTRCTRRATACRRSNSNSNRATSSSNRIRNPKTWWAWNWRNEPGRGGCIANLPATYSTTSNRRHWPCWAISRTTTAVARKIAASDRSRRSFGHSPHVLSWTIDNEIMRKK